MKSFPALLALATALAPCPPWATPLIHVKCAAECKVEIANKRGVKVNDRSGPSTGSPERLGGRGRRQGRPQGGWADIPAEGEVLIEISSDTMLVNGQFALDRKAANALLKLRKRPPRPRSAPSASDASRRSRRGGRSARPRSPPPRRRRARSRPRCWWWA
jgi:hypothetical protein